MITTGHSSDLFNYAWLDSFPMQSFFHTDSEDVLQVDGIIGFEDQFIHF
jgi:hypothetical protein